MRLNAILQIATLVSLLAAPVLADAAGSVLKTGIAGDGTRFYEDSLVIHAPVKTLWAAFTYGAAYRAWSVPVEAIDFRLGGVVETVG